MVLYQTNRYVFLITSVEPSAWSDTLVVGYLRTSCKDGGTYIGRTIIGTDHLIGQAP